MRGVLALVKLVAESDLPVLISGEPGTGKKLLGGEIHRLSGRSGKPLLIMDCMALPDTLIFSELFGGFCSRLESRGPEVGVLQRTDGGTLVLEHISSLSLWNQRKFTPAFQTGHFSRLPGDLISPIEFDVRLIATTRDHLPELVAGGKFLQEFYSYLTAFTIHIPLLRERKEDIPALLDHYLPLAADGLGLPRKKLSRELVDFFLSYPWPGNITELQAVLELALLQSTGDTVRVRDLPSEMTLARWNPQLP